MHRLLGIFIILFIGLLCGTVAVQASANKAPAVLRKDTSTIKVKSLNADVLEKYATDNEFTYIKDKKEAPSLWQRFWAVFWGLIAQVFGNAIAGTFLRYVLPGLAIIGLIYILLKAAGMDIAGLLRRDAQKTALPYHELTEDIHEIDFDNEIEKAASQHNYRLAVRLLYLKCLKQLSDKQLINWQIDKTNSAYYYELSNPAHRDLFGSLTRRFEYVWYGGFGIDEHVYRDISRLFGQFKNQLP